jgi:hypothetical protein
MARKASAQQAVDVLGMNAQEAGDVSGGEQSIRATKVIDCKRWTSVFHGAPRFDIRCNNRVLIDT